MSATAFQRKRREAAAKEPVKQKDNKPFNEMKAGEQIAYIETINTIEELEALKEQSPKQTALKAIEEKILKLSE